MKRGRPRQFDIDDAVEKAMYVFWEKGFDGATIPDLTAAIGINRPSLYAAFGSKDKLFERVLDHYRTGPASYVDRAIAKPTAAEVFRSLMYGVVDLVTDPENSSGCFFVSAALSAGNGSEKQRKELSHRRLDGECLVKKRFQKAIDEGDLPSDADAAALARLTFTYIWGISVQAVGGSEENELRKVAEMAIATFDECCKTKK